MSKGKHVIYKLADGSRIAGVTTIVGILNKPALLQWANNIGLQGIEMKAYVDDKADIGTLAHALAVGYLKGEEVDTADYSENQIKQAYQAVQSFMAWIKNRHVKLIWAEKPLVSEEYKYGGQPDVYAEVDGVLELLDFKTGSGIYPEHLIQVAGGYGILMNENKFPFGRVRILNIPRTDNENWGELVVSEKQVELNQEMFLTLLKAYNIQKLLKNEVVYPKKHEVKDD